jgi:hypothetical protein
MPDLAGRPERKLPETELKTETLGEFESLAH